MKPSAIFQKLKDHFSWRIAAEKSKANLGGIPDGSALAKDELIAGKLAAAALEPDPAKQVKVLSVAAEAISNAEPRNMAIAKAKSEILSETMRAMRSLVPGAGAAIDDLETSAELIDHIIGETEAAPKTLDGARGQLMSIRSAAHRLKGRKDLGAIGTSTTPAASSSSDADAELEFLREQFAAAGMVMPARSAAGMHANYLKRQVAFKAKSAGFDADAAAGGRELASAVGAAVTIRKADIVVPPTNADYLATYRKFAADPTAKAKRTAFYHEYGDQIQAALNDEKRESTHAARTAEMEARLKHT